jgi:transcriptional regulator with XRE-family HTH domain
MQTNTPLSDHVPAVIRGLMARRQLRQIDAAEASGVSQSQLSKILRGDKPLTLANLEGLATALDTTVLELCAEAEKEAQR